MISGRRPHRKRGTLVAAVAVAIAAACGPAASVASGDEAGTESAEISDNIDASHRLAQSSDRRRPFARVAPDTLPTEPLQSPVESTAPAGPGEAGSTQSETPDRSPLAVTVTVEPRCVTIGDVITATIETEPQVGLALIASYSDGDPHGQMGFGDTDVEGRFVWRWTLTPEVPDGVGHVLVLASTNDGQRTGTGYGSFEVVRAGGNCG